MWRLPELYRPDRLTTEMGERRGCRELSRPALSETEEDKAPVHLFSPSKPDRQVVEPTH